MLTLPSQELMALVLSRMVLMRYGPDLDFPWHDKQLAKKKFQTEIALLQPELARS